jgi:hypothetical protein
MVHKESMCRLALGRPLHQSFNLALLIGLRTLSILDMIRASFLSYLISFFHRFYSRKIRVKGHQSDGPYTFPNSPQVVRRFIFRSDAAGLQITCTQA